MIKALLRLVSMVLLAIAVIMAVLDATRSIATGAVAMTPLGASWKGISSESFAGFEATVRESLPGLFWDPLLLWLLALPGFAVFAALALLVAFAGRRRSRRDRYRYAA